MVKHSCMHMMILLQRESYSVVQESNKYGNGDESRSEVWDSDENYVTL